MIWPSFTFSGTLCRGGAIVQAGVTIREQQFGPIHPHTSTSLCNRVALQRDVGNFVKANRLYQCTIVIREQHLGPASFPR